MAVRAHPPPISSTANHNPQPVKKQSIGEYEGGDGQVMAQEIPLREVNKKLIRGTMGCEMAVFKFRKGCITFYVYAVRKIGNLGFSCADDLRTILQSVVELKDFIDHTAMLALPNQKCINYATAQPTVTMAY
ncbi:hypothetical protein Fot_39242 [Forsythia ovata]|uniref:DUF7851 domain-containing protein n=1 Tax=Forsythia ovata TaxID=205694 RepID=A0ABD1S463_9LAMI